MLISIARSVTRNTNPTPLPELLLRQIATKYSYMPDIVNRLRSLPVIHRGRNLGEMPSTSPHDNAVAFATLNKIDLYVGYLILPDPHGGMQIVTHSFCVQEGEVVEPTVGINWSPTVRYIGYRVKPSEYKNLLYLNHFNRLFI